MTEERRYTPLTVEVRTEGDRRSIGGYAAVFNRPSKNLGGFVEEVTPKFFNRSASRGWPGVVARFNHDSNMLLGSTAAGTLRLQVDDEGLRYSVEPPASRIDVLEVVERGDVRFSSFAFRVDEDEWTTSDQGFPLRSLVAGELVDVAPVVSPAYPDTTAALESLARQFDASLEEVRSAAAENELRRFFVRTDGPDAPKRQMFGAEALVKALDREHPTF